MFVCSVGWFIPFGFPQQLKSPDTGVESLQAFSSLSTRSVVTIHQTVCLILAWVSLTKTLTVSLLPCSTTMLFFSFQTAIPQLQVSAHSYKSSLHNISFCVATCTQNVLLHFSLSDQNMLYLISKILTDGNNISLHTSKGWQSHLSLISHS